MNLKLIFGCCIFCYGVAFGEITIIHKSDSDNALSLAHYSENNMHIVTPTGTLDDKKDFNSMANVLFPSSGDGKFHLHNAEVKLCGEQTYVVSIGINNYQHIGKLKYAVQEAKKVPFIIQENCPNSILTILLDTSASRDNILNVLEDIAKKVKEDDAIVIYFSGHGAILKGEKVLIPSDAKILHSKIFASISLDTVAKIFSTKSNTFIFADAMFREIHPQTK